MVHFLKNIFQHVYIFHWVPYEENKTQCLRNKYHDIQSHYFMANRWGNRETVSAFIFLGSKITADGDCSHEIKTLAPWKKIYDKPRQHIKNKRHHFADEGLNAQSYGFSISHVQV